MPSKFHTHPLPTERSFVMVKPDGVMRGLIGEVIHRLEMRGLKIIALKMVHASHEHMDGFYPTDETWIARLGEKGLKTFAEYTIDPVAEMGTNDPLEMGKGTRKALIDFMTMGPVVPMVVEGIHAISIIRKIVGNTLPVFADPGTIRGDYSIDAPTAANLESRGIFNIVHASETPAEAAHEVSHWFRPEELQDYDRADHVIMFGDKR
jgi:nucleoside-diphosphate kinase